MRAVISVMEESDNAKFECLLAFIPPSNRDAPFVQKYRAATKPMSYFVGRAMNAPWRCTFICLNFSIVHWPDACEIGSGVGWGDMDKEAHY